MGLIWLKKKVRDIKMYQDIILSLCSLAFGYALVPQVIYSWRNKTVDLSWQTIIITTIALWIFGSVTLTMNMLLTSSMNFLTAICWTILWSLKYKFSKL